MTRIRLPARINVKALVILVVATVALVGGAAAAYKIRKRVIADRALAAGKQAMESKDWKAACEHLRLYLSKYPDENPDMLAAYGRANLAVRPLKPGNIMAAIGAFRRLNRLRPGDDETCNILCRLYAYTGDLVEVEHIADNRREVAPDDPDAAIWRARALNGQGNREAARETLLQLLETDKTAVDAYVLLAGLALSDGSAAAPTAAQWQEAMDQIESCVKANPQSAEALAQRSRLERLHFSQATDAEERTELKQKAAEDLDSALALKPESPNLLLLLEDELASWGETDRATTILSQLAGVADDALTGDYIDPADFRLNRLRAASRLAMRVGAAKPCADLAGAALAELSGRHREEYLLYAVDLYLKGDRVESARAAVDEYRGVVADNPAATTETVDNVELMTAAVAQAEGDHYGVIERLRSLTSRRRDLPRAWRMLRRAYQATNQPRQAARALEQYSEQFPDDAKAYLELARELSEERPPDWIRILRNARAALELDASLDEARILELSAVLGGAEGVPQRASLDQAIRQLAALSQVYPSSGRVRTLEAQARLMLGEDENAVAASLERAIEAAENPVNPAVELARLHLRNGRGAEAIKCCEEARDKRPDLPDSWIALTELHLELDQPQQALEVITKAADRIEGDGRIDIALSQARVLNRLGKAAAALDLLFGVAAESPDDIGIRERLLENAQVANMRDRADDLIKQIRAIETDRGIRWKTERARWYLAAEDWRDHEKWIRGALKTCLAADPGYELAGLVLGELNERTGRWSEAEQVYRDVMAPNPSALKVANRLLQLLERFNRFDAADTVLAGLRGQLSTFDRHRVAVAVGQGKLDEAQTELRSLLSRAPDDVALRVSLAQVTYRLDGDADAALAILDQADVPPEQRAPISAMRSRILVAAGRTEDAAAVLDAEVERFGDRTALSLRAAFRSDNGNLQGAEGDYRRIKSLPDAGDLGSLMLGQFYYSRQRLDDAIAEWEDGLKQHPDSLALRINLTKALLESDQPAHVQRGTTELDELIRLHPDNAAVAMLDADRHTRRADRLIAAKAPREEIENEIAIATARLDHIVQMNPTVIAAHLKLINIERVQGHLDKARERALLALNSNSANPLLMIEKAALDLQLGQFALARDGAAAVLAQPVLDDATRKRAEDLHATAELYVFNERGDAASIVARMSTQLAAGDPDVRLLVLGGGILLANDGPRWREKIGSIVQFLKQKDPDSIDPYRLDARLQYELGQFDRCVEAHKAMLGIQPNDADVLNDLAWVLCEGVHDPSSALKYADDGIQHHRDNAHLHDTRGVVLYRLGRLDDARREFEKCQGLLPSDSEDDSVARTRAQVLFHLGRLAHDRGDMDAARAHLNEALKLAKRPSVSAFTEAELAEIADLLK